MNLTQPASISGNSTVVVKLSYLDAVPHVLLTGLLLQHLGGVFQGSAVHLVSESVLV